MSKNEEMVLWALLAIAVYWYLTRPVLAPVAAAGSKEIPQGNLDNDVFNFVVAKQGPNVSLGA